MGRSIQFIFRLRRPLDETSCKETKNQLPSDNLQDYDDMMTDYETRIVWGKNVFSCPLFWLWNSPHFLAAILCKFVATGIIVLFLTLWRLGAVFCIMDALDGAVFSDAKCKKRKVGAITTGPLCIVQSEALLLCCHACAWLSMCRKRNWTPESARLQTSLTKVNFLYPQAYFNCCSF